MQQTYLNRVAASAQRSAVAHGLYPSVMLAQSILESNWGRSTLGKAPNNNLFGMKKGDWTGAVVNIATQEWVGGRYITIQAPFRRYPNVFASFEDNAKKLRYGMSWSPAHYSGTWVENTKSYKDATAWLQGRYATEPTYAARLNRVIAENNLTQYDPAPVAAPTKLTAITPSPVYNGFYGTSKATGKQFAAGTTITATHKVTLLDGTTWYQVGANQFIQGKTVLVGSQQSQSPQGNVSEAPYSGVVRIKYVPGYSVAVWDKPGAGRKVTGKLLKHGTRWKTFTCTIINGHVWYNLGGNQWLDGTYLTVE